jgi:ABC-2 type transport system permease protein
MSTLWVVARQELLRAWRKRTFRVVLALVTLLLMGAFTLEALRQRGERLERERLQAQVSEEWKQQPERHPHRMAHYGSYAFRPPSALGFLDPGIEPFTGSSVYLEAHKRNPPNFSAAAQGSELVRFGRLSAAFVLQLLLPLLIFCMTFDGIAGERENGTWALALAQGTAVRTLVFGKLLAALLAIAAWVLPVLLPAFLALAGFDLRAVLLTASYALYLGLCACVGVLVSALHQRSHAALASLLCLWVACWVVLPRVAGELAARAHPVPARSQMEAELARASHRAGNGHGRNSPEAIALTQDTLARYGVSRVQDLPVNLNGMLSQLGEQHTSALYDDYYGRVYAQQRAQSAALVRWGVLSPVLLIRTLSMALAGSDTDRYANFLEQAEAHRFGFIRQLNEVHAKHLRYEAHDNLQRASSEHWRGFAPFAYRVPALHEQPTRWHHALLALLAWFGVALVALATRREVRS